jgi:hypothetical protein
VSDGRGCRPAGIAETQRPGLRFGAGLVRFRVGVNETGETGVPETRAGVPSLRNPDMPTLAVGRPQSTRRLRRPSGAGLATFPASELLKTGETGIPETRAGVLRLAGVRRRLRPWARRAPSPLRRRNPASKPALSPAGQARSAARERPAPLGRAAAGRSSGAHQRGESPAVSRSRRSASSCARPPR